MSTVPSTRPTAHRVCRVAELPPGARKIIEIDGRSIGVFNVAGAFHALRNVCPHKLAPLCLGPLSGVPRGDRPGAVVLERVGEVVRCPWHGWEFDLTTGKSVFNPHRVRVKTYEVGVERGCPSPAGGSCAEAAEEESVETFPVSVEHDFVVLYLA